MNKTIEYYDENATIFADGTFKADMTEIYAFFQKYCKQGSKILDFGCGSGRDSKYFIETGYQVDAIDGSKELCKIASNYTGLTVKHMYFNELNLEEKYDGIWACSSILHIPNNELTDILKRISRALKLGGYLYTSFKYGDFSGERNGRYFSDFTENTFRNLIDKIPERK
jgi:SAM-dependent methyltransferase